jgi:hypothetical protein
MLRQRNQRIQTIIRFRAQIVALVFIKQIKQRFQNFWLRLIVRLHPVFERRFDFFPCALCGAGVQGLDVAPARAGDDFSGGGVDAFEVEDSFVDDTVVDLLG